MNTDVTTVHETRCVDSMPTVVHRSGGALAQPRPTQLPGEFLSFKLGTEEYGIDILQVQEIRSYEQPTRIASAPDFVKGVVNLRGVIVPLVDLRLKFGLRNVAYDTLTVVIVLNVARRVIGVVVDSVSDVVRLGIEQIKPVPEFNSMIDSDFITGIGSVQQRMMILLDIEAMMRRADMGLVNDEPSMNGFVAISPQRAAMPSVLTTDQRASA